MLHAKLMWPFVAVIAAITTRDVSAVCKDPGKLQNGQQTVSPVSNPPYAVDTLMRFSCNANYELVGAIKIVCEAKGNWNSKLPTCQARFCSLPLPNINHATLLTTISSGVTNKIGQRVEYTCNQGYTSKGMATYKVCGKDGQWHGNFSCSIVTCQLPTDPENGSVSNVALTYDSVAYYSCNGGYQLIGPSQSICTQSGVWSGHRKCLIICHHPGQPEHGFAIPHYYYSMQVLVEQSSMAYSCDSRYELHGSRTRYCQSSGRWSGVQPTCVISTCGSPGDFSVHGQMTFSQMPYKIGTVVSFKCNHGYRLEGSQTRACLSTGHWTQVSNPTCTVITCEEPDIQNGHHDHTDSQGEYAYGTKITYQCSSQRFLWGNASRRCDAIQGVAYWTGSPPLCLTMVQFDKKCQELGGEFRMNLNKPYCSIKATTPPSSNKKTKINDNELDTLTIVTASAGSTLGALVILLSVLIFVRRFHRSRRFRNASRARSMYGDDDRLMLIATYSGDVHFQLPSYDEAISQVERAPPSFESVIGGAAAETNNNPPANTTGDEVTNAAAVGADGTPAGRDIEGPTSSLDGDINIVNNPLAENGTELSHQHRATNEDTSEQQDNVISDSSSLTPRTDSPSLPLSSGEARGSVSDDDLSQGETQPLIASSV